MDIDILSQIKSAENLRSNLAEKFGLKYNPFPRAGIANLNDSDATTLALQTPDASEMDDFCSRLSPELMQGLAEIAVKEHRAGRCIPHAQVEESIMESMGWK